jgi:S-DNA-T family DNA segregation ATPase FtsK/SpoIIIE
LTRGQQVDILAALLALAGVALGLLLLSSSNSTPVKWLVTGLAQLVGWGKYLIPVVLLGFAGLLVAHHFSEVQPSVLAERAIGAVLLLFGLLALSHYAQFPNASESRTLAAAGSAGGYAGALLAMFLVDRVGQIGSAVVLAGWLLVAAFMVSGATAAQVLQRLRIVRAFVAKRSDRSGAVPAPDNALAAPPLQLPLPSVPDASAESATKRRVRPTVNKPAGALPATAQDPAPAVPAARKPAAKPGRKPATPEAPATEPEVQFASTYAGGADWALPPVAEILDPGAVAVADEEFDEQRSRLIEDTLESFGAPARVVEVNRGPTVTQYGVEPDFMPARAGKRTKVKVNKISALAGDLALALAAPSIRIQAPVPGKGFVGIEVPNKHGTVVALRDSMETPEYRKVKSTLALAFGQDVSGRAVCADLTTMPHLLIAGTTGSGKSVCVNGIITSLLLNNTPDQLRILMVDPKRVELTTYNGIPHLLAPVVTDLERVVKSLQWIAREMENRYSKFAHFGARNIVDFNAKAPARDEHKLPYWVVIIDELADLMMLAPDEVERLLARLAQMARATGIHLLIATQRPSVDVVTGLIKANFPARIAFAVASSIDSRVILDHSGAEQLLGRGDMLFLAPDASAPQRIQGVFVSDAEIQKLVAHWREQDREREAGKLRKLGLLPGAKPEESAPPEPWEQNEEPAVPADQDDLYAQALTAVREARKASISLLQRRLRVGYTRAAKLIDALEENGVVGPAKPGAQQREVMDFGEEAQLDDQLDAAL